MKSGIRDGIGLLVMECVGRARRCEAPEKGPVPLDKCEVRRPDADALDKANRWALVTADLKPGQHHADDHRPRS